MTYQLKQNVQLCLSKQQYNFIKIIQMKQQQWTQSNSQLNRQKLIQQNIKLNKEIRNFEQKMSTVITMDAKRAIQQDNIKSAAKVKYNQITLQQNYIKKLKSKLKQLKALNLMEVTKGIVNQENQLVSMKKQYQKLSDQKRVLGKNCEHKKTALQYNNPLNQFKNETQTQLAKLKKKNTQMGSKIVQLERQVRKFHKYQQMHKKFKDEKITIENPQYQYSKIDHQKMNTFKKAKLYEQKWKPQIQALDKQYFQSKQNLIRKDKMIKQLQKELKNWQNRSSAVREQSDVIQDRQRISKVMVTSPIKKQGQKQKQKQKDKSPVKQQKKQTGFSDFIKNLFSKNNSPEKDQQRAVKSNINISKQQKINEKPDIRKWNNLAAETKYGTQSEKIAINHEVKLNFTKLSQKNEFMYSKNSFEGLDFKNFKSSIQLKKEQAELKKKNQILTNSVAVGTSFYYNEED